uniref:Putative secreted protein n=1 Tax=Anopheles darlingi TaxID=43151 RepID=A0A2M4DKB3_ANODA
MLLPAASWMSCSAAAMIDVTVMARTTINNYTDKPALLLLISTRSSDTGGGGDRAHLHSHVHTHIHT